MFPFLKLKSADPFMLVVGMIGVKMGDAVVQIGCADGGRLGAVAAKAGLSGRAVAIVPDEASAARARKGAHDAGALVDVHVTPPTHLPLDDHTFDLAVVDDTGGLLAQAGDADRSAAVREIRRVLRPGGRIMIIGSGPRGGLGALFSRTPGAPPFDAKPLLTAANFNSARTLAARDGLVFVEGLKPRT